MNTPTMIFLSLFLLFAVGLVVWVSLAMAQVERDLQAISGFEAMHFQIGRLAAEDSTGARRPFHG